MPSWQPQIATRTDAVPAVHGGHICAAARHDRMPAVHRTLQSKQPAHEMRCGDTDNLTDYPADAVINVAGIRLSCSHPQAMQAEVLLTTKPLSEAEHVLFLALQCAVSPGRRLTPRRASPSTPHQKASLGQLRRWASPKRRQPSRGSRSGNPAAPGHTLRRTASRTRSLRPSRHRGRTQSRLTRHHSPSLHFRL